MDTGHGGASGRFESLKEIALDYAFFIGLRIKRLNNVLNEKIFILFIIFFRVKMKI